MSAHVLLNLLNKLRKSDILSFFRNEFNKFINTGVQMLDSIYHRTLRLLKSLFGMKKTRFCHLLHNVIMNHIT